MTPSEQEEPATEPVHILIVEDEAHIRHLLQSILEEDPRYQVANAANGAQALAVLHRQPVDILLTDWMMDVMDGLSLVQQARAIRPLDGLFVIVVTAKINPADTVLALQSGADDFLTKPFHLEELEARVAAGARRIRREKELRLARDAAVAQRQRDSLTGLLNRAGIMEQAAATLALALRADAPISLALLDLDLFKTVNDRYGHLVGDEVLVYAAQQASGALRQGDWIGRWGGDEFLIILPHTSLPGAQAALDRVLQALEGPCPVPDGAHDLLQASIGLVEAQSEQYASLQVLLTCADMALYHAKAQGRHCIVTWPF